MRRYKVYQQIVSEVAQALNPDTTVKEGQWVTGPDGRRDLDVVVLGSHNGRNITVLIECKDWSRPVGIATIDALESKRRDVIADLAFVCSNSGFTSAARRKAARVGIGLITAVRDGDNRIRSSIEFDLYIAHVTMDPDREYTMHFATVVQRPANFDFHKATIRGDPFLASFESGVRSLIVQHLECSSIILRSTFAEPSPVSCGDETYMIVGVDVTARFSVEWKVQKAKLDATQGVYHYLQQKLEMVGNMMFKNINVYRGKRVTLSKEEVIALRKGQYGIRLVLFANCFV